MSSLAIPPSYRSNLKIYTLFLFVFWTSLIAVLISLNITRLKTVTQDIAIAQARAHFNKDQAFRYWAASHGGVYVPIDDSTPPSPYLSHVKDRDIVTPSGKKLTLMNPAYMVRQLNEHFSSLYGVAGHITSLKLLRPENKADEWERAALKAFEQGETERTEFTQINGKPYLRLIQPMITREGCLKCHAHQDYRINDIRGGVSISLPMSGLVQKEKQTILIESFSFIALWILGSTLIFLGGRRLSRLAELRSQAQAEIEKNESRFRTMIDYSYDWETWIRPDGSYEYVSPSCERITGYPASQFIDDSTFLSQIIDPDHQEEYKLHRLRHINSREGCAEIYFQIVCRDGTRRWIWHQCHPVFNSQGKWIGRRTTNRDITELKEMQETLKINEERLTLALHGAGLGLWDWNITTGEMIINERWAAMLGYELNEIPLHHHGWQELVHPDEKDRVMAELQEHLDGRTEIYESEHRLKNKSGDWVWVLSKGRVIQRDEKGKPLRAAGTHLDITDRKFHEQAELETARTREQIKHLESMKTMAGAIAHRFNNAMMVVEGNLDLMLLSLPKDSPEREMATHALQSAQGASQVGSMMLTYVGQRHKHIQLVNFADIVKESVTGLRALFSPLIHLHFDLPSAPVFCNVDRQQIKEVVNDIITNAVESLDGKEGSIEITFGSDFYETKSLPIPFHEEKSKRHLYIYCQVKDSGHGIKQEDIPRIFEPFFTTKFVGRGLGLALAAGIMQINHGALTIESSSESGTTVRILLPEISSPQQKPLRIAPAKTMRDANFSGNILLVDDEELVLNVGKNILKSLGFTVHTATNGIKALEQVRISGNDLCAIVMDVSMPHMDGIEALGEIRKINTEIPILLSSGYSLEDLSLNDETLKKTNGFLEKPFQVTTLKRSLRELLGKKREG
ncbi:MAG: PAS domain-containing protein [Desulfobulbaceae bacterium]|nr:PAS domain-containing protein [Desulfobulbaceae bacterium]